MNLFVWDSNESMNLSLLLPQNSCTNGYIEGIMLYCMGL